MRERNNLLGVGLMRKRLKTPSQQRRMIADKARTMNQATRYSYQGAKLMRPGVGKIDRGLINPDKNKMSYDDKILSVDWSFGYKTGDIFEWVNTKTLWIIYLQDLTELAYFRGEIRRCNQLIRWEDEEGNIHETYAAVQGPLSSEIQAIQKHKISVDVPNINITILIPKNKDTLAYFTRYQKFYLQGMNTCWRTSVVDTISMENCLKIVAEEYYANKQEDEDGIVGSLIVKPVELDNDFIEGPDNIKPKTEVTYTFRGSEAGTWAWNNEDPITVEVIDNRHIKIKWNKTYSGSFDLGNGVTVKTINVESLF